METSGKKKSYKIVYDRANCAGVLTCVAFYPNRWQTNKHDSRADLVGGKEDPDNPGTWILKFTEEELERFKTSAEVCPARVIHIIDLETNEEIKVG